MTGQTAGGDRTPVSGVDPNPLLREWPWLILAPIGLVVAFRRRRDMRPWLVSGAGVSLVASLYYFAYTFATGDDLQYGVFRFFVGVVPFVGAARRYGGSGSPCARGARRAATGCGPRDHLKFASVGLAARQELRFARR